MPQLYFFSQRPTFSSILFYQPTTIVSHRAPNLDVISNHNWVLIESTTPEQEEAGDAERADSKGSSMYPEK
jgi:hypothetical protein